MPIRNIRSFSCRAIAALAMALACTQTPARAAGWVAALKNTAAEEFDADDLQMFLAAARQTLEADQASTESHWSNPLTGASGSVREVGRHRDALGRDCRRVRFSVSARRAGTQAATWTACHDADGRWRLVSAH